MKKHRHIRRKLVSVLAALVVFCTTYALILPAVTLASETHCGKEEHTHTEDCYLSDDYLCGLEETTVEGHVHDETCYDEQENLICGLEEVSAGQGHVHTEECRKSTDPLCGREEHIHTRQCESDPEAVETEEDWTKDFKDLQEEDLNQRILKIAESQLGYKESEKNFRINEDGSEDGYTRYGDWAGDMYGDWNNAFTGFVLHYAEADAGFNLDLDRWIVDRTEELNTDFESAEPGHVIFYLNDEGQRKSGILDSFDGKAQTAKIYTGNVEKSVKKIERSVDQLVGTLVATAKDPTDVTVDSADSDDAAGEEEPDDADSDQPTRAVLVEGADNRVQSGDEITLTAVPQGFDDAENLFYQWQYNDTENAEPDAWKDLEGETSEKLTILVTEENRTYHWRVGITPDSADSSSGGSAFVEGVAYRLKPNIQIRNLEEVASVSDDTSISGSETVYSDGVVLWSQDDVPTQEDAAEGTSEIPDSFVIEMKWTKQPLESEVNVVPVSIRYGDYNPDTLQPDLLEGMDDPNPVIMSTEITYDSQTKSWKKTISYSDLLAKYQEEFPDKEADPDKFYVTENLSGYLASYERSVVKTDEKILSVDNQAVFLENGKKYVILNSSKKKALGISGDLNAITIGDEITEAMIWTAESDGASGFTFRNGSGKYLRISGPYKLTTTTESNKRTPFNVTNGSLYTQNDNFRSYIDYSNSSFTVNRVNNGGAKVYEVLETLNSASDLHFTITNTKIASGSFGSGNTPIAEKEIPHSKTIDYLGDASANADAGYAAGKDLSDSYRLYLDAGPIADENPVNLILVLDTSGSMKYALNGNHYPGSGNSRWDLLKNTLVGSETKSGILKDFYKLNTANEIRLITFASSATTDPTVYRTPDSGTVEECAEQAVKNIRAKLDSTSVNGGTNYEGALTQLSKVIDEAPRGYSTYVIFLSDGEPTYHGTNKKGGGNYTKKEDAEGTANGIRKLYADTSRQFTLSTIAYATKPTVFLAKNEGGKGTFTVGKDSVEVPNLPSSGGFCGHANDVVSLQEQLYLMCIGPRCDHLVIKDTLSENVDFDLDNSNIIVKAIPTGLNGTDTNPVTIYKASSLKGIDKDSNQLLDNEVPNFSFTNGDTIGTNANVQSWNANTVFGNDGGVFVNLKEKTIELKFNPGWSMDPTYRYEISFNVQTTEEAYNEYQNQDYSYRETGDPNSDYKGTGNATSSNRGGFFSNASSSLEYRYKNPYKAEETEELSTAPSTGQTAITEYQKPVIQTDAALLDLYKESKDSNHKLEGAVFVIYDDLNKLPLKEYKTNKNGYIDIGRVINGKTYYLKETVSPAGYLNDNVIFKVEFKGRDTRVSVLDGNGQETNLNADDYITVIPSGRRVTLTIMNEAGKPLPNTGGSGTQLLTSAGAAMIAGSLFVYGYKKRLRGKERRQN